MKISCSKKSQWKTHFSGIERDNFGLLQYDTHTENPSHLTMASNPRKFAEKIAQHQRKAEEEKLEFDKIMREVSRATSKVKSDTFSN